MFTAITHSSIFVLDQDQAVDFYVGVLGMEVVEDVDLGFMRWLTVAVPGHRDRQILLEKAGPPSVTEEDAAQVTNLVTKGAMGLACILTTDSIQKTSETLKAKGVEFTQEPTEQPYGIDCGVRDPFGNHIRITEPAENPGEITDEVKERWRSGG